MEKLLYVVWKPAEQTTADFKALLLGEVSQALLSSGAQQLQVSISDDAVAAASNLRQENTMPMMDGIISLWLDSHLYRDQQQTIIERGVAQCHGYLVSESVPIVNSLHPNTTGQRSYGMNQVAFFKKPDTQSREEWLDTWHNSHTQIAIETQSTFSYTQNLIVKTLTDAAPAFDAVVEEHFPPQAMSCAYTFFDAFDARGEKDDKRLNERGTAMLNSCVRFIDFETLTVIPTSHYAL